MARNVNYERFINKGELKRAKDNVNKKDTRTLEQKVSEVNALIFGAEELKKLAEIKQAKMYNAALEKQREKFNLGSNIEAIQMMAQMNELPNEDRKELRKLIENGGGKIVADTAENDDEIESNKYDDEINIPGV